MSGRRMEIVVSVQPQPWPEPVPEIAAAIRAMYSGRREVPLAVQVRDQLGELFADAEFASAFGARGKPGWSPGMLAMITVLQKAEDLTDRQAADAVRTNLAWKYALGLELTDPGFDHTVLSEFRARVVQHRLEEKALDLLLAVLRDKGLVTAGGKQRTDSTHVIAAVRDLNRLELAGEAVRACLEALSAAAPHWVAEVLDVPGWSRRYQQRIDTWRLPASQTKKDELALSYGKDGFTLLAAVYAPASPTWLRELPAVEILRVVLVQNYTRTVARNGREVIKRRGNDIDKDGGLPPGCRRLTSPYDTDARWGVKRDMFWNGFKVHISETCAAPAPTEPAEDAGCRCPAAQKPNLITNVATTDATVSDSTMLEPIHQALRKRDLLPDEHYLDSGYPSAELIVGSLENFGIALITPVLLDRSRQAKAHEGFAASDFAVDWQAQRVTCPAGQLSSSWTPCVQDGVPKTVVTFSKTVCGSCPHRAQCTTAKSGRRQISLHPREMTEALRRARAEQETQDWQKDYALRAGVEGTIRQATAVTGLRRARYRGLAKTHLDHVYSAAALNLIRLDAWWNGHPLDRTRTSHLSRLELSLAA
ncbi:IS1182 family transposase [Saccharopolyspora hattusasensis]|uniref:IS1182 family transposase n=1 Tax=Saccharopolyspora hattusasensis TaxID=1128679 RepID=UPI003D982C9D